MRVAICLVVMLILSTCQTVEPVKTVPDPVRSLGLEMVPGANYTNWGFYGIFPYCKGPQMAAWVEDSRGVYCQTLMVTDKTGRQNWIDPPRSGRPESLPVWAHRRPSALDVVATATKSPHDPLDYNVSMELPPGTYNLYLEVNSSYDWNSVWQAQLSPDQAFYNGINGQPSLVYHAQLTIGSGYDEALLIPIGHGAADGQNGDLVKSLSGFDSALHIVESVTARTSTCSTQ